jgi:hypothetical protein
VVAAELGSVPNLGGIAVEIDRGGELGGSLGRARVVHLLRSPAATTPASE